MYNSQDTATRIRTRAKQLNITINQLLYNCNLGKNTVTKISNGTDILTQNFMKIANELNCSIDYLVGRTDIIEVNRDRQETYQSAVALTAKKKREKPITSDDRELLKKISSIPPLKREVILNSIDTEYERAVEAAEAETKKQA